ncbi:GDP-mannose 4,6-dehydratase [Moritella sp. 24]|uniref:NAD-dependent epimerase/dehydratase family protein n=1 Tax=Moritella sp. 24 TaxID=2746230 RepID=UPI001BAA5377|nr:GDP-mannose 4,6-dehydratase [Moritella sp. 24]QUM77881.1 GDP-mannose 4,6-dehydratase [Moritella sp. 24]
MDKEVILVTGANGFTGQHFIKNALEKGFECIALVRKKPTNTMEYVQYFEVDLLEKDELRCLITNIKFDYIVHLAAVSYVGFRDCATIYKNNIVATLNLIDLVDELVLPLKKIIVASTGNIYGRSNKLPITETTIVNPVNHYSISKLAMEKALGLYSHLPIIVVRPFNYTGNGQSHDFLIPKIISEYKKFNTEVCLGNLDVSRDFSDVRDVVEAYTRLLTINESNLTLNVCSGISTSIEQIIKELNLLSGYEIKVTVNEDFKRDNEILDLYGSNDKLINLIGEYQKYSIKDTLYWMLRS